MYKIFWHLKFSQSENVNSELDESQKNLFDQNLFGVHQIHFNEKFCGLVHLKLKKV